MEVHSKNARRMKSVNAKGFIDELMNHLTVEMSAHAKYQLRSAMTCSAELAEDEAYEQMRQKSVEAFKSSCMYKDGCGGAGRACDPTLCEDLRLFIQKLDEI